MLLFFAFSSAVRRALALALASRVKASSSVRNPLTGGRVSARSNFAGPLECAEANGADL